MPASFRQYNARSDIQAVCSITTQCIRSFFFFPAIVQWVNWFLLLNRSTILATAAVNRHVFDLDGVCHVGEMISAPADVLKGTAGKVSHDAKAKARPAMHTQRHTVQAWHRRCVYIVSDQRQNRRIQIQTHTHMKVYTVIHRVKGRIFMLTPPLVQTHPFCLNS